MTASAFPENPLSTNQPRSAKKFALGCGISLSALLLLIILAALTFWMVASRRANEELAAQVAKIRARGEPLTTPELNDFYQPAANRPDMTQEIMAALALC